MESDLHHYQNAYRLLWQTCPYSSFQMFNQVLVYNRKTIAELLAAIPPLTRSSDPKVEYEGYHLNDLKSMPGLQVSDWLVDMPSDVMEPLWDRKHGLCTSFTIRVRHMAAQQPLSSPLFSYGSSLKEIRFGGAKIKIPKHRVGWCPAQGIIIDSSARKTYLMTNVPLPEGTKAVELKDDSCNIIYAPASKPDIHTKITGATIEEVEKNAMHLCLQQLLYNQTIVTLFRAMSSDDVAGWGGMMVFDFGRRRLSLGVDDKSANKRRTALINWHGNGNSGTEDKCIFVLSDFLSGNIPGLDPAVDRWDQFSDLSDVFDEYWKACNDTWGRPTLEQRDVDLQPTVQIAPPTTAAPGGGGTGSTSSTTVITKTK